MNMRYERPQVMDLSARSVDGQEPLGQCMTGGYPYSTCTTGPAVGGTPSCNAGVYPFSGPGICRVGPAVGGSNPDCWLGNNVLANCATGTNTSQCGAGTSVG